MARASSVRAPGAERAARSTSAGRAAPGAARGRASLRSASTTPITFTTRSSTTTSTNTERGAAILNSLKAGLLPTTRRSRRRTGDGSPLEGDFPVAAQRKLVGSLASCRSTATPASTRPLTRSRWRSPRRRADHDPLRRALHRERPVLARSRVRARSLRARRRSARAHAASAARSAHESQSRLGEPRWPQPALLALSGPHMQQAFPARLDGAGAEARRAANRVEGSLLSASRRTRSPMTCTSSSASSWSRSSWRKSSRPAELPEAWNARASATSGSRSRTTRTACSRTSTGQRARSDTSRPTRSAACSPPRSGRGQSKASASGGTDRARRVRRRSPPGCARPSTATAGEFTPAETIERVVGGPLDVAPYMEYLKASSAISTGSGELAVAKAGRDVVVDHADRLHERVADRRPDEAEAAPLQVLAQRLRLRGLGGQLGELANRLTIGAPSTNCQM